MEGMVAKGFRPSPTFWQDRRVLVTGHTGFKGSWLCLWLTRLGANVIGISLPNSVSTPNLFELAKLSEVSSDIRCDIRDAMTLSRHVKSVKPDLVFHLAAQPLVRRSYRQPAVTFSSNVQGTANILDAVQQLDNVAGVIAVTSDKCYLNDNLGRQFSETDPLGGHDPYSASKAAAEMVIAGYRSLDKRPPIISVRAGNIIGGGDWGEDRLIPDIVRALTTKQSVMIRNPTYTRPWQHLLDCLSGYLAAAEVHFSKNISTKCINFNEVYNFGPSSELSLTVGQIADRFIAIWGEGDWRDVSLEGMNAEAEAESLGLNPKKAMSELNWQPRLQIDQAIELTAHWYREQALGADARLLCDQQIAEWMS